MPQSQSMLDDLLQSTKATLTERLSSPLLGGFSIAWCLWNYKFLVILFSSASVARTFELIETVAFPDALSALTRGLLYPLLAALAYVFIYPYPARFVYGFTHKMRKATNRLRQQIEDETPLTLEESRKLRAEYTELNRSHQETLDRLNSEMEKLKEQLQPAEIEPLKPPVSQPSEPPDRYLDPSLLDMLEQLDNADGSASEYMLEQLSGKPKLQVAYALGELVRKGLIERLSDENQEDYYVFTHEGRGALLNARAIQEAEELEGVR